MTLNKEKSLIRVHSSKMFPKVWTGLAVVLAASIIAEAKYSHFFVDTAMTYQDAVNHCRKADYDLLNIESASKHAEALKGMRVRGARRMWIGLNRRNDTHDDLPFQWSYERIPLQKVRVFFWGEGEPNNFRNHSERCVEILDRPNDPRYTPTNNWNDQRCEFENPFMCERY